MNMSDTTRAIRLNASEFAALLASLGIDEIPGFPETQAAPYLDRPRAELEDGLRSLIERGLAARTDTGIGLADDLLAAIVRLTRPATVTWAVTTVPGPQQRFVDIVGDRTGFVGLAPRSDGSMSLLIPDDATAVAALLAELAGVTAERPADAQPFEALPFSRSVELVRHALGAPHDVAPPSNPSEELLAEVTSSTTLTSWTVAPEGESAQPREVVVLIARDQAWLGAPDATDLQILPVGPDDLTRVILGEDGAGS